MHRGLGTAGAEPQLLDGRHAGGDLLGEVNLGFCGRSKRRASARRSHGRSQHRRVRMAEDQRPPRTDEVEVAVAIYIHHLHPFTTGNEGGIASHCLEGTHR